MPLTIGTAGHIDHGKTWLVRALTGKETDRLPEERKRGISIDLGYAPLELPNGRRASLVDVPGHERFVRTMVAGATGIDLFLLVVDAREAARPQTHEHLAILRLLGIEHGAVAVTKADSVDADTLAFALAEARGLVPGAPVVATSAVTGAGLEELRAALGDVAERVTARTASAPARLFVDRVFSLRGVGTVATGTLWSGSIGRGDELAVEPGALPARVRSVHVHDRPVERAEAGQRVAVSLPGIERTRLARGDALVEPRSYPVSYRLDVSLEELAALPNGARLHVHHGTAEHYARLVRVGDRYAQLRLDSPAVAARGDRVVLRDRTTVGGGVVIDPAPPRHASVERIQALVGGNAAAVIHAPVRSDAVRHLFDDEPRGLERAEGWIFSPAWLDELRSELERRIEAADPIDPGIPPPAEPWATAVLPLVGLERRGGKLYRKGARASLDARAAAAVALERAVEEAGLAPVQPEDRRLALHLEREGRLVRLGDGRALSRRSYEEAKRTLVEECELAGSITLARFRDLLGVGRRTAQLLLERFDADGLTRRVGEERVLRKRPRSS